MTLKYGFVGLPVGGAKAGIVADPEMPLESKRAFLKSFGQAIEPFLKTRSYIPAGDLGTSEDDIRFMLQSIGLKPQPRDLTHQLSGFYTGITVFAASISAARHIGLDLSQASVAIEGFGLPVAEAMGCGVPVIITDALKLFQNGCAVVPARNPAAFAVAIRAILTNPERSRELSISALDEAVKFTVSREAEETYSLYESVLAEAEQEGKRQVKEH